MRMPLRLLAVLLLPLLAGCPATTKVAVVDNTIRTLPTFTVVVVCDDVEDPAGVGEVIAEAFRDHGINAYTESGDVAFDQTGSGSGFVVADGYWVTNNHVIKDLDSITITITGRSIPGRLLTSDPVADLAIIKAETTDLKPFKMGTAEIGEGIYVIGFPIPSKLDMHHRVTSGVISSLSGLKGDTSNVQFTAPIQPGNSGGPIFGEDKELAGVVVSTAQTKAMLESMGAMPQGLNFGVSPNILSGMLAANGITPKGPYVQTIPEAIQSTGMIWNGETARQQQTYVAQVDYSYMKDIIYHVVNMRITLTDSLTGDVVAKTRTECDRWGVEIPANHAVDTLMQQLGR
ncbi:MAG: S1C family serine protease [Desulfovibrionaceae bacterium]